MGLAGLPGLTSRPPAARGDGLSDSSASESFWRWWRDFADRIAVMYLGRITEQDPARQVVRHPRHPYTKTLPSVVPARDPRVRSAPQLLA
jgi:oligopeptide/dipeptide transporter